MRLETLAIHRGHQPVPSTDAVAAPVHLATSRPCDDTRHRADRVDLLVPGTVYTRTRDRTSTARERQLAIRARRRTGRAGLETLPGATDAVLDAVLA